MAPSVRRVGVALAALALALSACGSDDTTTEDESSDAFALVQDGTLTVCTDAPNEPFQVEDPGTPSGFSGFDIDLVQAVAQDLGLDLQVRDTDFDRITDASAMAAGECDLAASAITISDAWATDLDFTEPYLLVEHSLLVPTGSDIGSLEDAVGTRVGAQTGTTAHVYLVEHLPDGAEIVVFASPADLLGAVVSGDVDAVLQDRAANAELARSDAEVEVVATFDTGERYGFAVAVGREDQLLDAVQLSLDSMADDGTYDRIHERYFGA